MIGMSKSPFSQYCRDLSPAALTYISMKHARLMIHTHSGGSANHRHSLKFIKRTMKRYAQVTARAFASHTPNG
jgi:ATP-dependent protease ClpP protease subunit